LDTILDANTHTSPQLEQKLRRLLWFQGVLI
jgi:hypothetical protein